jgi:hypothetical protein
MHADGFKTGASMWRGQRAVVLELFLYRILSAIPLNLTATAPGLQVRVANCASSVNEANVGANPSSCLKVVVNAFNAGLFVFITVLMRRRPDTFSTPMSGYKVVY